MSDPTYCDCICILFGDGFSVRTESVCGGGGGMGTTGGGCEEKIFVSVRLTPLNEKEIVRNDVCDWECINEDTIIFKNYNLPLPDRSIVFRSDCSTMEVYEKGATGVALSVVSGINCDSGKTFTMTGITECAIADIYHNEREFLLKFSAMEIYKESVRDLLSTDSSPLRLLDDPKRGIVTEKLTEEPLRDWNNVMELLSICEAQRQIGETALNETSSKSHQIIRLTIESSARQFLVKDYLNTLTAAVRASQSLSAGTRLKEGCLINRSLLTLGTVICKLRFRKLGCSKGRNGHVPFRDSKLTHILQSSLGGNARTAIIRTMSPVRSHVEQSRNTLLFASCAKEVTTNTQVNVVISDKALVKHLQRELARLESELRSQGPTFVTSHYLALLREKGLQIEKLEKEMIDLTVQRDLAQCQVQDLLQLVGDEGHSTTRVGFNNYPCLQVRKSPEFENPVPETSSLESPHSLDIGVRSVKRSLYSYGHSGRSSDDHCIQILLNLKRTFNSGRKAEESNRSSSPEQSTEISESMVAGNGDTIDQEFVSPPLKEDSMLSYIPHFIVHSHEKPSPWPLTEYGSGSQSSKLTKSRSCKASLMTSPYSPGHEKDIRRSVYELNYGANIERLSRKGSQSSIRSVAAVDLEAHRGRTTTDDNITKKQVADNLSDPTDSIYVEVELKRLSLFKDMFSRGSKRVILSCLLREYIVMGFSTRDRRLIHGGVSGFVSGASESCGMGYSSPCSHLHLH
ncbi:unnamed protein product [Camellia sinensis]